MNARDAWTLKLWTAAPQTDWPTVRTLACILGGETTKPDVLLIIGDALAEAARDLQFYGAHRSAGDLKELADLVHDEGYRRALAEVQPAQA
jgi:hypothetical protein